MKKQVWVDVHNVSELRIGDRVRYTDFWKELEDGGAVGDGDDPFEWRIFLPNGCIDQKSKPYGGYTPEQLLLYWEHVQVLRNIEDCPDSKAMAFDALCAVHEVLRDVPEYGAFVTLKDGRQVQVRAMVLAAIEELDKWQKGSVQ